MFDFFDDIFKEIKHGNFRYQVDSNKQIAVEGYKNILKIDENCVILRLSTGEMCISGANLKIKEFGGNTIIIFGEIYSVTVEGEKNAKKK